MCFFLAYLIFFPSSSQAIENDLGLWTPVYIKIPVTNKFKTNFEVNPRIQENITHINQLLIRPSVGYQLTENFSVWQGYAWVTNYIPDFVSEQRIWQQLLHEKKYKIFQLTNRFRIEERFIQNIDGVPVRIRHQLRTDFPFTKDKKWALVLYDELFINLNSHDKGPQAGIDQNRFFAGLNKKINGNVNLEGGYLMQYINIPHENKDKLNHNVLLSVYCTLPQLNKSTFLKR